MLTTQRTLMAWSAPMRLLGGLGLFVSALLLQLWLLPWDGAPRFAVIYPAMMLAFLYFGIGAGVLNAALGGAAAVWYMLPQDPSARHVTVDGVLTTGVFLLCAAMLVFITRKLDLAHAALRQSLEEATVARSRVERINTAIPAMLHSIDLAGTIIAVSDLWLSKLGYTRDEVVGRPLTEFLSPSSQQRSLREVRPQLFDVGWIDNIEYEMRHKDGSLLDILLSAVMVRNTPGEAPYSLSVCVDLTARRRAERRLIESEARYRALVEDQSEMVSLATPDGELTFVNHAYARHFNCFPADMLGTSLYDYLPDDDRAPVRGHLAALCASGGVITGQNRMLSTDGSGPRWVAWTNRALYDAEGRLSTIHSVGRDITEQKTLESQMQAKAREVEDLYQNAPCGYHSVGSAGKYIKINATELGWLGCRREEVVGLHGPGDFLLPEDAGLVEAAFQRAKASGEAELVEGRLRGRHGVERDVSFNIGVVRDEDGDFLMTRSVVFDITARKQAERALQRLNHEQLAILDCELFGIARLRARVYRWLNSGLARILGYAPEELIGHSIRINYPDQATFEAVGASAYPTLYAGGTYRNELTMLRRDGSTIWVELTAVLLDRELDDSLWMFADITARKQAELALRHSQSLLARTGSVAGIGGWELDLRTQHMFWADETFRILGLEPGAAPDRMRAMAFVVEEDLPRVHAALGKAEAEGLGFDIELRVQHADARSIWVRAVASVEHENGRPARLVGAMQDITATVEQRLHIEHLYTLAEQQRAALAIHRERDEAESELAAFLLSRLWRIEQLDQAGIQYFWKPAEAFSGDIIAVTQSRGGDVYGMLADATGHGLSAAINIIPLTSAFYAMAAKGYNLTTICGHLNELAKEYSLSDRFVAVTLARFRQREQELEVINAGNPAALLLDTTLGVVREFQSGSIPLGILGAPGFRARVETVELLGGEQLLMFSDGLIEACNQSGVAFGRTGLDQALRQADAHGGLVEAIRAALRGHSTGVAPADDVSVLALAADGCRAAAEEAIQAALPEVCASPDATPGRLAEDTQWDAALKFSCTELRQVEAVPVLVDLTRTMGLRGAVEARFFTVLSELFQNALEHGLLGLDSRLKRDPDGFEHFLAERSARLAALATGEIRVRISHWQRGATTGRLQIQVSDSGPGFDVAAHLANLSEAAPDPRAAQAYGRGIALVRKLCDAVEYRRDGNEVVASFDYPL